MLRRLKNLSLRLLLRFSDGPVTIHPVTEEEKELIRKWMVECYAHPGYQLYSKYREAKFIISLADLGVSPKDHPTYLGVTGQRFEILRQRDVMRKVYEKNAANFRKKQAEQQNTTKK